MNPYQQYLNFYDFQKPYIQQNPSVLPPQTVVQVNGKASVDALKMSPNSSVLLMDNTAPLVWLCVSDGLGNVTSKAYDITEHQDIPPIDVNSLETRVTNIESVLNKLMEAKHEPNVANVKRKQSRGTDTQSVRDNKSNEESQISFADFDTE